ncbi:MAG: 7-cyano-7-deazaguanine synthase QueC [Gemmatimonadetes bacterium]|nr:7-cyano-7-deazaguanine synthase QueC [Gemmatimonadota bacterium]
MDSLVTAAIASREHRTAFLHITYGQRTAARERQAFDRIAAHYDIATTLICDLSYLSAIGGSSLTDRAQSIPTHGVDISAIPNTYVPFRNAHILSIAVSWAETLGAGAIYIGAVEEDSSGYPDCSESFLQAFEIAANRGTRPETGLTIQAPLLHMRKSEIVARGRELDVPFELSWSCYKESERACGVCDSCRLRRGAFEANGLEDPIPYA